MDEESGLEENPFEVKEIHEEHNVFRQVHFSDLVGPKKKRFPSEAHFAPDPDGLSVYWGQMINAMGVLITIGLSFKKDDTFKNPTEFKVLEFTVSYLRSIEGVLDLIHTPQFNGNPAAVGSPNIPSHASVRYGIEDLEVRVNLSDYCRENREEVFCSINANSVLEEVEQLRLRLNDTPYHIVS
ncbi:MAG: hypothetical protein WD077_05895 [Bacteroidia bacterium]